MYSTDGNLVGNHAVTHQPGGGDEIDTVITSLGPYTLTKYNVFLFATAVAAGGAQAITLPTAIGFKGKFLKILSTVATGDYMTLTPVGTEKIQGDLTYSTWPFSYPDSGRQVTVTLVSNDVDWIISNIYEQSPFNRFANAMADPAVTDDSTKGLRSGSVWINILTKAAFICTSPNAGAAVWKKTTLEIATTSEAVTGTDDTKAVSPSKVFDILNSSTLRNMMLNGCFDVWQRGTSFSTPATNAFTADRWLTKYNGSGSTYTVSKQAFTLGQTDVPNEPASYLRYDVTVAGTGESFRQVNNIIESVRSLAGKKITLSFYAKASSSINLPNVRMQQYFGSGGSPSSDVYTVFATSIAIGTTWAKYSASITIPSISGKTLGTNSNDYLSVNVGMPTNSAFRLDIAQFQLEPGEIATAFELRSTNHEIMHCQRYYIDFTGRTINGDLWVSWPTTMRSAPTLTTTAGTVANASVNGCTVNNSAAAATIITAASEM